MGCNQRQGSQGRPYKNVTSVQRPTGGQGQSMEVLGKKTGQPKGKAITNAEAEGCLERAGKREESEQARWLERNERGVEEHKKSEDEDQTV